MPGEIIDRPNPPPDPSHLAEEVLKLSVKLDHGHALDKNEREAIQKYRRAANYIAAGLAIQSHRLGDGCVLTLS